ncbi:hypothetical protein BASA81_018447 [Batrachochytrium salamandrivorans]|nr:hypothetical protein BASA81_018447 [Batrachochytrium salamandrivorans]
MSVKGKAKNTAKGNRKSKSSKRGESHSTPVALRTNEEAVPFLTLVMIESHKFAIQNYRQECYTAKSEYNSNRELFRRIESEHYSRIKSHQLDILPDSTLHEELLNRQLKKHLISVKQDRVRYEAIEQSLEQENMELIRNHLKVGWNLSSEVIKVLSDGSVINVHGWGAQVPDPEIVMSCNTIREYGHEAQVAQLCPIAQVVHSELPVPCTSTVGKSNSISDPRSRQR